MVDLPLCKTEPAPSYGTNPRTQKSWLRSLVGVCIELQVIPQGCIIAFAGVNAITSSPDMHNKSWLSMLCYRGNRPEQCWRLLRIGAPCFLG